MAIYIYKVKSKYWFCNVKTWKSVYVCIICLILSILWIITCVENKKPIDYVMGQSVVQNKEIVKISLNHCQWRLQAGKFTKIIWKWYSVLWRSVVVKLHKLNLAINVLQVFYTELSSTKIDTIERFVSYLYIQLFKINVFWNTVRVLIFRSPSK